MVAHPHAAGALQAAAGIFPETSSGFAALPSQNRAAHPPVRDGLQPSLQETAMALGDGIRRNIASVGPTERGLFRDALIALNQRVFPGSRTDSIPGGVSWWFKQDEIHKATHVHGGPAFVPWHRELV